MKRQLPEVPELTEEELATEMIELTCEEMDSLSRAFNMISKLCAELQGQVSSERAEEIPEKQIN
jgi:hypothetical protein